jgi:hypothetical protein
MADGASTEADYILSDDLLGTRASCNDVVQQRSNPDCNYIWCTDLDHISDVCASG